MPVSSKPLTRRTLRVRKGSGFREVRQRYCFAEGMG